MADFNSDFWSWWVIAIVVGGIVWCAYLLLSQTKQKMTGPAESMGHVWDENLEELNNPLPRWWMIKFYITIFFGVAYLALYPGLGAFEGLLGWTEKGQYEAEVAAADAKFGPIFDKFAGTDVAALAGDDEAMKAGERLYVNYCAVCHGSDARGATGFPNLRDGDWLYGGSPEAIKHSITLGRQAVGMMAWKDVLGGDQGVEEVTAYVMSLSGRDVDTALADKGKQKYDMICVGCHMPDGSGNQMLGAPNLADDVWLYGGSPRAIRESIANGRNGYMPPQGEFLGESKVHILTAYIYSLSQ